MRLNKNSPSSTIAFGGVMAALAVVIMSLGGLIPIATFTTPMLCALLLQLVYNACGKRIAWAWFGAVAFLSALLSPDKEAAGLFIFLGYYPMMKPIVDRKKFSIVWKLLFFNTSIFAMYFLLMYLFGLNELREEFAEMGKWMLCVFVILGNITFGMVDYLLGMKKFQKR